VAYPLLPAPVSVALRRLQDEVALLSAIAVQQHVLQPLLDKAASAAIREERDGVSLGLTLPTRLSALVVLLVLFVAGHRGFMQFHMQTRWRCGL